MLRLLVLPAVALIQSCGVPTVEEMIADPKVLKDAHRRCTQLERSHPLEEELCSRVSRAYEGVPPVGKPTKINKQAIEINLNGDREI